LLAGSIDNADLVFIERFLDGETKGFDELVVRYQSLIYNICLQMLGNSADAEDATQEIFVAIFKGLRTFKARSALSTWIYRIVINKCRNYRRSRPAEVSAECDLTTHHDTHEEMQNRRMVRSLLQELAPHYRAVLVLRYFQQLSYEEIGETLGWSPDKVKCYLSRARKHFKQAYALAAEEGGANAMR
jgi:RNA polymerase sigma-70 factor, ECF subfamily